MKGRVGERLLFVVVTAVMIPAATAMLLSSCSSQRQRNRMTSWEQQRTRQLEVDSARVAFEGHRQVVRISHTGQQVLILPEGPFSFQPDSGFRGEAALVRIEQWSESGAVQTDSVSGSGAWHREFERSDSSDRFDASDELEVTRTVGFQFASGGWWWRLWWVSTGVLVIAALWFLRRGVRHWVRRVF